MPLASPLHADLHGLPPLLIQVGTSECLLDDAVRLADKARAAGVEVTLEPSDGMIHDWDMFAPILSEGREAIRAAESRVGNECVSACGSRRSPYNQHITPHTHHIHIPITYEETHGI